MSENSNFLKFGHYISLCAYSKSSESEQMQIGLLSARGLLLLL